MAKGTYKESNTQSIEDNEPVIDTVNKIVTDAIVEAFAAKVEQGDVSVDDLEAHITRLSENGTIKDLFLDLIEQVSNSSVDTIESIMYEKVLEERAFTDEFLARQNQKWGKAFVASEALYLCILESTTHYEQYVGHEHSGEENYTYCALKYIHARALQMYSEILCLIQNGFADGAYARWRSLYELSIIAAFISLYGSQVAEAYVKSVGTNSKNEWARTASCFTSKKKREKITFKDLFENSGVHESWDDEYKLTNLLVHGSADGTFNRLGTYGNTPVMSVGRSDWGMSLPAIHAAMSLALITGEFFSVYTHGDSIAAISTFNKWISIIKRYYEDVEEQCFPKEPAETSLTIKSHGIVELS